MPKREYASQYDTEVQDYIELKQPSMYKVILLNDHYTSMDFVTMILRYVFNKSTMEAEKIMLSIHEKGSGVAGIYTREIAETRCHQVAALAVESQFPLRCIMEKS